MSKYTRRLGAPAFIVLVSLLGACSSGEKKGPDSLALGADTTLNRDLAMANRDSTSQPELKDVPATTPTTPAAKSEPTRTTPSRPARKPTRTPPRETAPAPAPAPVTTPSGNTRTTNPGGAANAGANGGGSVGMIAAGTTLNTTAGSKICTNTNAVGDHVTATVENSVQGSNGAVIPAGATVNMTVTQLKRSENANDKIIMEFAVNSVSFGGRTYPLDASVQSASVNRIRDEPKSKDVQKVATGAVIGAIAGRILGHSTKGTVIGGAVGAAGGAAAASATANYSGCIDQGSSIVVRLNSAATVKA
ncbi:MAG TPA: hypothetical protein VGM67_09210 [Gemmatimonadaceae bacterium]|jgi:hypothetical protein